MRSEGWNSSGFKGNIRLNVGNINNRNNKWQLDHIQWNLSITDTIGESQFIRYREVSLVERFMTIITIIVIHINVVIIILKNSCKVASLADARLSYSKDTTVSIREPTLVA